MLVRLLYASRTAQPMTPEMVDGILNHSRKHNPERGITGVLAYTGDVFIQVLEGGRGPVNNLYNKIAQDPRHDQVTILSYEEMQERKFSGWTMGQVNLSKLNQSMLLKYSERPALDPFSISGTVTLALLHELIDCAAIGRTG